MKITIEVPEEQAAALAAVSAQSDQSVKKIVFDAVSLFLKRGCGTPSKEPKSKSRKSA